MYHNAQNGRLCLLRIEDIIVAGSVEDVDVRSAVLGEVMVDSLVSAASVKINHSDLDPCSRRQS